MLMKTKAAFIHSDQIDKYHYPAESPFKTERSGLTREILNSLNYLTGQGRKEVAPQTASEEELLLFHKKEYLDTLKRVSKGEFYPEDLFMGLGTADCPVFADLYNYASLASGGTITGARLILNEEADIVFNPSGGYHHAFPDKAGGFCYLNDVVLACRILADNGKRVFCLDLDAHHGNGTQNEFYSSPRIFTVSFHESGKTLFPWSGFEDEIGEKEGKGYNLNLPLPPGTDDDAYLKAFTGLVPPLISAYDPDVLVMEIGMDILSVDPLTHLGMTNNVIADIIPKILSFDKPILAVGGGGYNPDHTARGWALTWCALCRIGLEEDLNLGLGGTFLGSSEWKAGLRDKHIYLYGENKKAINAEISKSVEKLKKGIFPLHGI